MSSTIPAAAHAHLWPQLRLHISEKWPQLTRSLRHALEAARDPKSGPDLGEHPRELVYVSSSESPDEVAARLARVVEPEVAERLEVRALPGGPAYISDHGLLYLPGRYVVPGGRFNELYGWDSYFISLGLLRDGRVGLAQSVAEQCLYEVEHYGSVLNCNRTYCLTRSHPPFLGRLVLAVFAHTGDQAWLRKALPLVERYHAYWNVPPHFVPGPGLARYHAFGEGPAVEVLAAEIDDMGLDHYQRVCNALRDDPTPPPWLGEIYDAAAHQLTPDGYRADRTIRESGFDLTHRLGFCGLDSRSHVPVCLNSLLWRLEMDIAEMREHVSAAPESIAHWRETARQRAERMEAHFWDEGEGLYLDWNLRTQSRSTYAYATAFWPLWAGWAAPDRGARVARRLPEFMATGGLMASLQTTGCQWDAPFSWAPLVLMAADGLADYGFADEAREVARRFLTVTSNEFARTGLLFEKYDATDGTADVAGKIHFGYPTNEPGFGWTNAVVAELAARPGVWP